MQVEKYQFHHPTSIIVTGASQSGKTTLVSKILREKNRLFTNTPPHTILIYKTWQPKYNALREDGIIQQFIHNIPEKEVFLNILNKHKDNGGSIIFFDDIGSEIKFNKQIFDQLFTVYSHHYRYILQYCYIMFIITIPALQ
jgi:GTPase SAR1 family protein